MYFDYDLIVVGGGPAGCAVARDVAASGFRVLVLEEHRRVGEPLQCSGLISPRTLEISRVPKGLVQQRLTGARVHAPGGRILNLTGTRPYALAIDRILFDRDLAGQALASGAVIREGQRVTGLESIPGGVCVSCSEEKLTCQLVVGADGHGSLVARWLALPQVREMVPLFAADVEIPGLNDQVVDIFLGRNVAPGWFGWVIPTSAGQARVGAGALPGMSPRACFQLLAELYPALFQGLRIIKSTGGLVPVGMRSRTWGPHAMVVGDAAGHVKPISGGGLYLGLLAADRCAQMAKAALSAGKFSAAFLSRYQLACEATIGREIRCGLHHRDVFLKMSDAEMNGLIAFLDRPYWRKLILKYGDLDHHTVVAEKLTLAPPWAQRFLANSLKLLLSTSLPEL